MPFSTPSKAPARAPEFDPLAGAYLQSEPDSVQRALQTAALSRVDRAAIAERASDLIRHIRKTGRRLSTIDAFLQSFSLSSKQGLLLMRLAESLIRTPDTATAALLLRDKLAAGQWLKHLTAPHLM
ncbi:MAG: hypothetical protein AAFY82_04875, partial [Pseudomonadota bacterium]